MPRSRRRKDGAGGERGERRDGEVIETHGPVMTQGTMGMVVSCSCWCWCCERGMWV